MRVMFNHLDDFIAELKKFKVWLNLIRVSREIIKRENGATDTMRLVMTAVLDPTGVATDRFIIEWRLECGPFGNISDESAARHEKKLRDNVAAHIHLRAGRWTNV